MHVTYLPLPPREHTDVCENITFPQFRLRAVTKICFSPTIRASRIKAPCSVYLSLVFVILYSIPAFSLLYIVKRSNWIALTSTASAPCVYRQEKGPLTLSVSVNGVISLAILLD